MTGRDFSKTTIFYPNQHGFTLLEVMVALAILTVVAVTAMQAAGTYTQSVNNIQTRTLAHFVAQNTLADLRLNQQWVNAPQTLQVTAQGQNWQVTITPTTHEMPVESVKQITIAVAPVDTAGNVLHTIVDIDAMLVKPVNTASPAMGRAL